MLLLEGPPSRVGISLGIGIFVGCSPLYGLHGLIAIGIATLFGLNPLIAFVGTQISFPPLGALLIAGEVAFGEWVRFGRWGLPQTSDSRALAAWVWEHALLSWALGSVVLGAVLGVLGGLFASTAVRARRARKSSRSAGQGSPPL